MSRLQSIAHYDGFTLEVTATVSEAMASMLENGSGTVVLLVGVTPVGIVTESLLIAKLGEGVDLASPVITLAISSLITINENRPIESAFDLVVSNNVRRLIMVNDKGAFKGLILQEDLFDFLEEEVYKVDLKVVDLLSPNFMLVTILEERTIQDALVLIDAKRIGSVIVTNTQGEALGIITEKDILSAGHRRMDLKASVVKLMSSPVHSVQKDDPITEVISLMRRLKIRRVLVKDESGTLCGILTNRDIFHHIKGNVARMLEIKLRHAQEISEEFFDLFIYVKRSVEIVLASLDYHHIKVVLEAQEGTFFAKGYPNEFAQAILNLLNNARDALSQSSHKPKEIHIVFTIKKEQTSILFCDNGGGIRPALLPMVFEPFVTEKQESGGTGAGLYITRLIIEQKMGGKIEVYNGHDGACFQILLPKF